MAVTTIDRRSWTDGGRSGPTIVCLCGSTRFKEEFLAQQKRLTLEGKIFLTVGFFGHVDEVKPTIEEKLLLDELHLRKIDLADEILVINPGHYIGESTRREILYAIDHDKVVRSLERFPLDVYTYAKQHGKLQNIDSVDLVTSLLVRPSFPENRVITEGREPTKQRPGDQPLPVSSIAPFSHDLVCIDMAERKRVGVSRYGIAHQAFNGRNTLRDLYEELLDACCYIRALLYEKEGK